MPCREHVWTWGATCVQSFKGADRNHRIWAALSGWRHQGMDSINSGFTPTETDATQWSSEPISRWYKLIRLHITTCLVL